jgi:hypothetical protein
MKNLITQFFRLFKKQSAPIKKTNTNESQSVSSPNFWDLDYKTRCKLLHERQERIERNNAEYEEQQRENEEMESHTPYGTVIGGIRFGH